MKSPGHDERGADLYIRQFIAAARQDGAINFRPMSFFIEPRGDHLRILVRKRSAEDMASLAQEIFTAAEKHQLARILVRVEESDAIFAVEKLKLFDYLERAAKIRGVRIALVSDSSEVFASHQYIELLASQRHVRVKAFRREDAALQWLLTRKGKGKAASA